MKRFTLIIFLSPFLVMAQMPKDNHCATMEMDSLSRLKFPERGRLIDFEDDIKTRIEEIKSLKKNGRIQAGVVSLPIIVHVVHNGEAIGSGTNISQAQVQSQIAVLNEDFRKMAGTPGGASTNPIAADIEIEFCLSPVDENGNTLAEPGIKRYNGGRSDWTQDQIENQLKPNTISNPNLFYNIWTVKFNTANASLIGYAQFPDQSGLAGLPASGSAATDGVVIRYQSFGSVDKGNFPVMVAPYNKGRTLSHETGHWLGLRHIWGDGPCADDFVADTPPQQSASSGCPIGRFSCNSTNMVQNYMDYSDDACMNLFTEGQKTRMQAVIQISPRRKSLVDANLCSPPVAAAPVAKFEVENPGCILLGSTVSFTDLSSNFPNGWHWTFEGGNPSTSTERNPKIVYSTPGTFAITFYATNSIGNSDTLKLQDYIVVTENGICRDFNNYEDTYTPSLVKLSSFGNYKGYLTGTNSTHSAAVSEYFTNECGYAYISGLNIRFGKVYTSKEDATINFVVWNARGPQSAPGSVIERKSVLLKQISEDINNAKPTSIVFDRETPIFGKPFQVGIEIVYNGDSVAIVSSANGEGVDATSWIKDSGGLWKPMAIAYGANVAMDIEPVVGMNPSVQVSASKLIIYPGQEVIMNGRGASIFVWNSQDGAVSNFTGPQLIVAPLKTTTYVTTGSGLELCSSEAQTTIYVSDLITKVPARQEKISIFPNPGNGSFNITGLDNNFPVQVFIYNQLGAIVYKTTLKETDSSVSQPISPEISSGIYLIKIVTGNRATTLRWINL